MRRIKALGILLVMSGLFIMFQGCATIIGGRTNTLVFKKESLPQAKIYIDGEYVGEAPGKIRLSKEKIQHGSMLEIKAEGYENETYLILRKQHALYSFVDIVIGALPLGVDYLTGNIYRPDPRSFVYKLEKVN